MKNKLSKERRNYFIKILVLISLSVGIAAGQQQQPTGAGNQSLSAVELKGKVPVNKKPLKINLPKTQETRLANGLRVVVLEDRKLPTFSMRVVVETGSSSEPANLRGLSAATAALIREGTKTRTSRQIAEQVESLGGRLGSGGSSPVIASSLVMSGETQSFDLLLEIFADVLLNPAFPAEEVEKYKTRIVGQITSQRSNSAAIAQQKLFGTIYGASPISSGVTPPVESVQRIKAEDVAAFYNRFYRPNNAILAITGDVNLKEILPKLERAFGMWQKDEVQATKITDLPVRAKGKMMLVDRSNSVQTTIYLGTLGIEQTNPDYFPLLVANEIFGAGPASRLFAVIREEKGYTYSIQSFFFGSRYPGVVVASATSVKTDVTGAAVGALLDEIKRIREIKVSETEIDNAKRALTGSFALSLEQPETLLSNFIDQKIYGLPANYWETYPQRVAAVNIEDVQRVARKYYDPETLNIVAVGDAAKIKDALVKYGTVEVFDAEGKSIKP
ncbi:MAG: insulinase family protein [Acidobacteriota bacterium]|nr:insulinase family protein [Acidobacteriota bacterium]